MTEAYKFYKKTDGQTDIIAYFAYFCVKIKV
jgi:hypothetical protein